MPLPMNLSDLIQGRTIEWECLEFKEELDLAEGRSTSIPKILRAMKANGSPPPELEFDEDHSYFLARVPVQPNAAQALGQLVEGSSPPVTAPVMRLLKLLSAKGPHGNAEIRAQFGLKDRTHLRKRYVDSALTESLIEPTIPDKPTSRPQQYRFTKKGRALLAATREGRDRP
jgi:ATP-dependent DNA helicase RecG